MVTEDGTEMVVAYLRDRHMADNIRWLYQRFGNAKTVTTSHNEHLAYRVGDDLYNIQWNSTGFYLREYVGSGYVSLGQTFYQGSFHCYWGNGTVGPPLEGSYEYFFEMAKTPLFYLDLRMLDTGSEGAGWIDDPRLFRSIDEGFTGETQDRDTFCLRPLTEDFDIIIYIEQSSPFNYM
jgi:erythromycin esterase-like protein